jgi:hypothetical protein
VKLKHGNSITWNFGWLHPDQRTDEQQAEHIKAVGAMPRFAIQGEDRSEDADKALLFELWKHPHVVEANGFEYPGVHQVTGSCVGAGGGNALMTLACVEAIRLGEPEQALIPFWLLPYGRSRFYCGMKTPGEGSLGSCFARAAKEDGVIPAKTAGLPSFDNSDGLVWGSRTEMSWSDGDAKQTLDLLGESRKHLVQTVAQCANSEDVRKALFNGYPCTAASMYAHKPSVTSDPPVLLGRRSGSWSHQMSILGCWNHPKLGWIFWLQNQWGDAHGHDPAGGPIGGVWITADDVSWICRDEVFAFSQFQGFPAPTPDRIPWLF